MIIKLKEIAQVKAGNSAPKKDSFGNSGIPFVRAGSLEFLVRNLSIDECEKVGEIEAKKSKLKLFPKGSILFAKSGMSAKMGRVYQLPRDAFVVNHLAVIIPNEDIATSSFLKYYFIGKPPMYLIRDEAYPSIKLTDIEDIELDIPDIETQNKIVTILDKASALLQKRQQSIDLLDELLRAQFLEMFGSISHFEPTQNSKPLGNYINIKHGFAFKSQYFTGEGKFVLLTPGNFKEDGGYRDRGEKQKYYEGPIPDGYILKKGDLLVAMTEQAPGLLGSPVLVPENNTFLHNQRLGLIELKDESVNKHFLFYLFNTGMMRNIIHVLSTGVKVRHTSPTKIEAIEVSMPAIQEQDRFSIIASNIESSLSKNRSSLYQINELFYGILQRAFSGKLNLDISAELDALLDEINLQKSENDLYSILSNEEYVNSLVERLNTQNFENQDLYDKAKHAAFQILKTDEILAQKYDDASKSLILIVK
ncbi:restriction endonuclease subunit S [uncultured Draconibacterium sp.]|uniref:restriction endonuclease subunit S n=1 Tax=uncultured Draconibacterium sp. TaxID=1573823 RepID=UPI002AA6CDDF|nr:restriction endonuclease subunit S [uncultured Draconibacterium sp.]